MASRMHRNAGQLHDSGREPRRMAAATIIPKAIATQTTFIGRRGNSEWPRVEGAGLARGTASRGTAGKRTMLDFIGSGTAFHAESADTTGRLETPGAPKSGPPASSPSLSGGSVTLFSTAP